MGTDVRDQGRGRLANWVTAGWGAITGAAPHVLHHIGPLAGAAILAGFAGRMLFFVLGLVAAIPMLRRLYRRFHTWAAPAIAVAAFAAAYTISSLVVAPLLSQDDSAPPTEASVTTTTHAHDH